MKTILFAKLLILLLLTLLLNSCTADALPTPDQTSTDIIPIPPTAGDPVITTGPKP